MRVNVTLACTECGDRNYITKKINVITQNVLKCQNTVQEIIRKLYTEKLNNIFNRHILCLFFC